MIRTEISLFLKNSPGELGKVSSLLSEAGINIDALMIQDASAYVQELFKARGKSLKRIASVSNYSLMKRDSADFALIRLLPDKPVEAAELLGKNEYLFDTVEVMSVELENSPGALAEITDRFGQENININYIYGSVLSPDSKCLFVFAPEDILRASKLFK